MLAEQNNVAQQTATDKTNTSRGKWNSLCVITAGHISLQNYHSAVTDERYPRQSVKQKRHLADLVTDGMIKLNTS